MWSADICNNPDEDYRLYFELLEDDTNYRGRIDLGKDGHLTLTIYPTDKFLDIPVEWLKSLLAGAQKELGST